MPRFPVLPQRTSTPAAFSSAPRAQAAHFGAGIGRNLAGLGLDAAELGRTVERRRDRQVKQQLSQFDLKLAKQRMESDAQAPPDEESEARVKRHRSIFDSNAEALSQSFDGKGLRDRLAEGIDARRAAWDRKLLEGEARKRLRKTLQDTQEMIDRWSTRVASDPAEFAAAFEELLGDDERAQAGLLTGLGLRPEALAAWRSHAANKLLDARMTRDPAGLIADLEQGRWQESLSDMRRQQLLGDARDRVRRVTSLGQEERTRERGEKSLELSYNIAKGAAGASDVHRAEDEELLSRPQAEALRADVKQAETARQAREMATSELSISLGTGVGFDAQNPQNREAADAFYEVTFRDVVRAGADEATQERIAAAVAKTGYVPKGLAQDLNAILLGGDEAGRVQAAELYGRLRDAAPDVLEKAVELETRARAGVLNHWLEQGLAPAEALARSETVAPRDTEMTGLALEETAALKRALHNRLGDGPAGWIAERLLDQLAEKYQSDLAGGLSPRAARSELQKHAASALIRLDGVMAGLAEEGFVLEEQGGRRVLVQTEAQLQDAAVVTVPVAAGVLLVGAALMMAVQNAQDMGLDVGDDIEELVYWINDKSWEVKEALFFEFPDLAPLLGWSVIDIPGDKRHLGQIADENDRDGIRFVDIQGGKYFRGLSVLQRKDAESGAYVDETGRYLDRHGNAILIDLKTGRVIPPEELGRYLSPPLEPQSGAEFAPGGFGEGVEIEQSITTGGDPADHSLLSGQPEGLIPPAKIGDRLPGFPDQSDIANGPWAVFSRQKEEPWPTGYEVDPRTWYPDWQGFQEVVPRIPQAWGVKLNQNAAKSGKREKPGVRWQDPVDKGNRVRVDKGNPEHEFSTQQVDHVRVDYGGKVIGPDGEPIVGSVEKNHDAHIPLSEYLQWRTWYKP